MTRQRRREGGYILLGIVIGVVILGIFMAAAVPVWKTVVKREKEEELIWRANQYLGAIERYQRKFPGAFPPNLEILRSQKFIRKLYKDPMTAEGDWQLIRQLTPGVPGAPGAPPASSPVSPPRPPSGTRPVTPSRSTGGSLSSAGEGIGGIIGVASKSKEKSLRIWNGKEHYNEWGFVYTPLGPPGTGQPGVPGQPGMRPAPGAPRPPASRPTPRRP